MSTYAAGSRSDTSPTTRLDPTSESDAGSRFVRLSAGFGVAFALTQLATMVVMATTVLPLSGSPTDPVLQRGQRMLDAASTYRIANYIFILSGLIVLGFLGAVQTRLRRAEPTGTLATVAVAAGGLIAFVWPFAGVLHDLSLDVATAGGDLQFLAGWDAVAPYSLAFSTLPRVFFLAAIVLGLRAAGEARALRIIGAGLIVLSLIGSATLVFGGLFPVLALSTLGFELWVGALAWHWFRHR
jgi:hypothetical protein